MVGCGIYDISCPDQFGMAFALTKGTAEHPLRELEDLYDARIVLVSKAARSISISEGMTRMEALTCVLGT